MKATETTHLISNHEISELEVKREASSTFLSAVFNLFATMVGAGAMALPYTLSVSGYTYGILGLFATCVFTLWSAAILTKLSVHGGADYTEMASHYLGFWGMVVTQCSMLLLLFGALSLFLIISVQLLFPFVAQHLSFFSTRLIVVLIMVVISLPKTLHGLRHISSLAIFCLFLILALVVYHAFLRLFYDAPAPPPHQARTVLPPTQFQGLAFSLPMQALSYAMHVNVPRVYHELTPQARPRVMSILVSCLASAFGFYIILCSAHIYYMRGRVGDDLLADYPTTDISMNVARIMLSLTMILKAPLVSQPLLELVAEIGGMVMRGCGRSTHNMSSFWQGNAFRIIKIISIFIVPLGIAILIPKPSSQINIIGSTCGVFIAFVIPGIMFWARSYEELPQKGEGYGDYGVMGRVQGALLVCGGVFMGCVGLMSQA